MHPYNHDWRDSMVGQVSTGPNTCELSMTTKSATAARPGVCLPRGNLSQRWVARGFAPLRVSGLCIRIGIEVDWIRNRAALEDGEQ